MKITGLTSTGVQIFSVFTFSGLLLSAHSNDFRSKEHHPPSEPKSAEVISTDPLEQLKAGNHRFRSGKPTHPFQDSGTIQSLAGGQSPHSIIVSCSDSRTAPEILFDQGLGRIFSIRTAGHQVASPEIASIEYAVEHLGARLIVIMGHESCGAVKAAVTTPGDKSLGSPHLDAMVHSIQRNLASVNHSKLNSSEVDPKYRKPAEFQTQAVSNELLDRSAILREFQAHHGLKIIRAIYKLENGQVDFL